jgi:hypothetical protein
MTADVDPVDPVQQKALLLEESEERALDREAPGGSAVEHRTSDEATPPPD